MVKVKVQTAPKGTFPTAFGPAWAQMSANKAETGFPYRSLVPLWSRQVPYTVAKFFFFEKVCFLHKTFRHFLLIHYNFRSYNYFILTCSHNQKILIQKQHNSVLLLLLVTQPVLSVLLFLILPIHSYHFLVNQQTKARALDKLSTKLDLPNLLLRFVLVSVSCFINHHFLL